MTNIQKKIKLLYPREADRVYRDLRRLLDGFKKESPIEDRAKTPLFTEKDTMLICYADHVQEERVKTLKTMGKFLKKYAEGYVNKIHFLPFYPYSSDDGFSVMDYEKVNPPFGAWGDIRKIGRNFEFMFDFVVNHASVKGKWFRKFLQGDKKYSDFFIAFDEEVDVSKVFRPRTSPLLTPFKTKKGLKYVWTTFSEDQADLNFKNPEVFLAMVRILLLYIKNGARAIRLDAVAYVWKELGTSCFDLPQAHTLVQLIHDIFEDAAPDVWLVTETVLPHKENTSYFGSGRNEAHLVYNFVLETLLLAAWLKQDTTTLSNWVNKWRLPSAKTAFLNLSVSHDGIHTIPAKGIVGGKDLELIAAHCHKKGGRVLYRTVPGREPQPYEFNITYPSALGQADAFLATQAIQLALKGVPLIYLNNFIGAENWTEGVEKLGYGRAINRQKFNYDDLTAELENPDSMKGRIYRGYTQLLKTRASEPLFSPLAGQKALKLNPRVMAVLRFDKKNSLLALTNVSAKKAALKTTAVKRALKRGSCRDLLSRNGIALEGELVLAPYQTMWLK